MFIRVVSSRHKHVSLKRALENSSACLKESKFRGIVTIPRKYHWKTSIPWNLPLDSMEFTPSIPWNLWWIPWISVAAVSSIDEPEWFFLISWSWALLFSQFSILPGFLKQITAFFLRSGLCLFFHFQIRILPGFCRLQFEKKSWFDYTVATLQEIIIILIKPWIVSYTCREKNCDFTNRNTL